MIDINAEAEKSLSDVKCKAVFQYPKNFNNLPIISYYTVTECGGFYADNEMCIRDRIHTVTDNTEKNEWFVTANVIFIDRFVICDISFGKAAQTCRNSADYRNIYIV